MVLLLDGYLVITPVRVEGVKQVKSEKKINHKTIFTEVRAKMGRGRVINPPLLRIGLVNLVMMKNVRT